MTSPNSNVHLRSSDARDRQRFGFAGQTLNDPRVLKFDATNSASTTPQTMTFDVSGTSGEDAVEFEFSDVGGAIGEDNYTFQMTTSADATTAALAAAEIVEGLNKDYQAQRFGFAEISGTSVVFNALRSGTLFAFGMTRTSAILSVGTSVAATDASELAWGTAVFTDAVAAQKGWLSAAGGTPASSRREGVILPVASYLTAATSTIAVGGTAEDSKRLKISITDRRTGERETFQTVTPASATNTNIATDIQGVLAESEMVAITRTTTTVTLTAKDKGRQLDVAVAKMDTSTNTYTVTETVSADDVQDLLRGVIEYSPVRHDTNQYGKGGSTGVPTNEQCVLVAEGPIKVAYNGTPARGGFVYVGTGTGENGKFYTTPGTDRVLWRRARWTGVTSDGVSVIVLRSLGL